MGGTFRTKARLFLDSIRAKQSDMERICSLDPTQAMRQKTEAGRKLLEKLEDMHEKFERLMKISDTGLQAMNSNERSGPLLGEAELVSKIAKRKMDEKEYIDLTEGPTLIVKREK